MSTFFDKLKISFGLKKPEPWYKKILKKSASVMDMKRRNKFITFFVLLFIAIYFCLPSVESIIKRVVHQYGSQIIGTDVSIGGIDLELSKGIGVVKDIKIANPKGYQAPNLFYLKELGVEIDISSLTSDTIIIDNITINNPEITYEMKTLTQSNISDILNRSPEYIAENQGVSEQDYLSWLLKEINYSVTHEIVETFKTMYEKATYGKRVITKIHDLEKQAISVIWSIFSLNAKDESSKSKDEMELDRNTYEIVRQRPLNYFLYHRDVEWQPVRDMTASEERWYKNLYEILKTNSILWFLDFVYRLRNALFHEIIDPLDEEWQIIFKNAYLVLKEIVDINIVEIEAKR